MDKCFFEWPRQKYNKATIENFYNSLIPMQYLCLLFSSWSQWRLKQWNEKCLIVSPWGNWKSIKLKWGSFDLAPLAPVLWQLSLEQQQKQSQTEQQTIHYHVTMTTEFFFLLCHHCSYVLPCSWTFSGWEGAFRSCCKLMWAWKAQKLATAFQVYLWNIQGILAWLY